jgi:hypothetical protein
LGVSTSSNALTNSGNHTALTSSNGSGSGRSPRGGNNNGPTHFTWTTTTDSGRTVAAGGGTTLAPPATTTVVSASPTSHVTFAPSVPDEQLQPVLMVTVDSTEVDTPMAASTSRRTSPISSSGLTVDVTATVQSNRHGGGGSGGPPTLPATPNGDLLSPPSGTSTTAQTPVPTSPNTSTPRLPINFKAPIESEEDRQKRIKAMWRARRQARGWSGNRLSKSKGGATPVVSSASVAIPPKDDSDDD